MLKYPRTPHIEGSRLGTGDDDILRIPFSAIRGLNLAVEEKIDGANCAISFGDGGELLLQSRGHFLRGGGREEQFALFKLWASTVRNTLYDLLGKRYLMYGEWMFAKHAIFYDALPHYFFEFDIFDKERGFFLDTEARRRVLSGSPIISAPTLYTGRLNTKEQLLSFITDSPFISPLHLQRHRAELESLGLDPDAECHAVPRDRLMEGLYVKVEDGGRVVDRMKFVRGGFTQVQLAEDGPRRGAIVKNLLKEGVSLF